MERTVYYKDLEDLTIVCYVRQEFDAFRDVVHKYDVIVKGLARLGINHHYLLLRDQLETKKEKTMPELLNQIKSGVRIAISRLHFLHHKALEDAEKLETYLIKLEKELKNGK